MLKIDAADSYAAEFSALVIAEGGAGDALEALRLGGIRVRAQADFARAAQHLGEPALDLIVIEAAGAPADLLDAILAGATAAADQRFTSILVAMSFDQLDAAAMAIGARRHLLCEPSIADRLSAIAMAKADARDRARLMLHDVGRDGESVRLQRLNEEVARIAETLARLTRSENSEQRNGSVRDSGITYRGPADDGTAGETSASEIRSLIRSRRLRAQYFPPDLFADPAWDMLLDLFAAQLEHRRVSVSSLCIAAAVPPTTALRWIGTMHEAGLFERQADPSDRRRAYIALSPTGLEGMRSYVGAARRAGLALA